MRSLVRPAAWFGFAATAGLLIVGCGPSGRRGVVKAEMEAGENAPPDPPPDRPRPAVDSASPAPETGQEAASGAEPPPRDGGVPDAPADSPRPMDAPQMSDTMVTPDTPAMPDTLLSLGAPCTTGAECASGFCGSGVCCQSACTDTCSGCNFAGSVGTCTKRTLLGHWKLDETTGTVASDASCHANHGTLREYATSGWGAGRVGGSLGFDGMNNWVRVPASTAIDSVTNKITIAAWVYRAVVQTPGRIIAGRQTARTDKPWLDHYVFWIAGDRLAWGIANDDDLVGGSAQCSAPSTSPTPAGWFHAAATYDGTIGRVYMNGVEVCRFSRPLASFGTTNKPFIFGAGGNNLMDDAQEVLNGRIDDLVLYSRALSPGEISSIYMGGAPPLQ